MLNFLAIADRDDPDEIPILGLGLSHDDLDYVRSGRAIRVSGATVGLRVEILVFAGATDAALQAELSGYIGPQTVVLRPSADVP